MEKAGPRHQSQRKRCPCAASHGVAPADSRQLPSASFFHDQRPHGECILWRLLHNHPKLPPWNSTCLRSSNSKVNTLSEQHPKLHSRFFASSGKSPLNPGEGSQTRRPPMKPGSCVHGACGWQTPAHCQVRMIRLGKRATPCDCVRFNKSWCYTSSWDLTLHVRQGGLNKGQPQLATASCCFLCAPQAWCK